MSQAPRVQGKEYVETCFKCGRPIRRGEESVFSSEWDAFCHLDCCPVFNEAVRPDVECQRCDVYLTYERYAGKIVDIYGDLRTLVEKIVAEWPAGIKTRARELQWILIRAYMRGRYDAETEAATRLAVPRRSAVAPSWELHAEDDDDDYDEEEW